MKASVDDFCILRCWGNQANFRFYMHAVAMQITIHPNETNGFSHWSSTTVSVAGLQPQRLSFWNDNSAKIGQGWSFSGGTFIQTIVVLDIHVYIVHVHCSILASTCSSFNWLFLRLKKTQPSQWKCWWRLTQLKQECRMHHELWRSILLYTVNIFYPFCKMSTM